MFDRIYQSAYSFRKRFSLKPDVDASTVKLSEEIGELADELNWLRYYESSGVFRSEEERLPLKRRVVEEFADVVYSGVNMLIALGIQQQELEEILEAIAAKNDAKNLTNCSVVDGVVVRNEKLGNGTQSKS